MKSQDIPLVVRRRRKELDLTQSELADLAEVSERLVRDLEGGRLTIGTDKFLAILDALGLENKIVTSQSNEGQSYE
jgi:HTH-type transcriptional regulator/antitoxin HipB